MAEYVDNCFSGAKKITETKVERAKRLDLIFLSGSGHVPWKYAKDFEIGDTVHFPYQEKFVLRKKRYLKGNKYLIFSMDKIGAKVTVKNRKYLLNTKLPFIAKETTGCSKQVTVELLGLIDVRHRKDNLVEPQGHVILRRSSS